jgi:dephospho-CoA kinase
LTISLLPITLKIMKIIGLTGGIGSGKSEIAAYLKQLGAAVIDADKVGHDIFNRGTPCWQKVVETFGREILDSEGNINRKSLAKIVFQNPQAIKKLNSITHPVILDEIKSRLLKFESEGFDTAVVEAALLIEAGWAPSMNEIWLALAPEEIILERLIKRGLSEEDARARIASQIPGENKKNQATVILVNDGSLDDLKKKVAKLWFENHYNK